LSASPSPRIVEHLDLDLEGDARLISDRSTLREYRSLALSVAISDGVAVLAGFGLSFMVRFGFEIPSRSLMLVMLLAPAVWVALLAAYRAYDLFRISPAEEFRRIVAGTSVGITLVVMLSYWMQGSFSRLWLACAWLTILAALVLTRRLWHGWLGRRRACGEFVFRTLIIGTNEEAERIAKALGDDRHGYHPVGYVQTDDDAVVPGDHPSLGSIAHLPEIIDVTHTECVFIAASAISAQQMENLTKAMRRASVEVRISTNLPETLATRLATQTIDGVTALSVRPVQLTGPQAAVKRTLDVVVAMLGIFALSWLFVGIAIAVKVSSRGPILFGQMRTGRGGEPFALLKFRTMVADAEARRGDVVYLNQASGPLFKVHDDPRVTRVGRWLRKWSLDELPQLFNVITGEMSLVGPRPALPDEVSTYERRHLERLEVRPGITGLWQVSGRADLDFEDYVRLDLFYIENWSVSYDVFILAKTIPAVLARKGSY
jgi:exopolysaccharide biosynthesis polyprenyl glycosylphosphotransferase